METFSHFVTKQFVRLINKFRKKHAQYQGTNMDELANFRVLHFFLGDIINTIKKGIEKRADLFYC